MYVATIQMHSFFKYGDIPILFFLAGMYKSKIYNFYRCKNKVSEQRMDSIYFNYLKNHSHLDIIAYWKIMKIQYYVCA